MRCIDILQKISIAVRKLSPAYAQNLKYWIAGISLQSQVSANCDASRRERGSTLELANQAPSIIVPGR